MKAQPNQSEEHKLGFFGATSIGVGAIVGGGILALAGVAFAASGPGAMAAIAINGLLATLTALSIAELASRFPQSGGAYNYARRVLSVEVAFVVGWIVWFASAVAAVLYAMGFGVFARTILAEFLTPEGGAVPAWIDTRALALLAVIGYSWRLMRKRSSGSQAVNSLKVLVFLTLILGGLAALSGKPSGTVSQALTPFLASGWTGLAMAMGFTFIAMQGFDLIAISAGQIKEPQRIVPRAMLASLAIALGIYLPLLFVISVVGVPTGTNLTDLGNAFPETLVAVAGREFLGTFGYWLVLIAGLLSMLSALEANLAAAATIARSMAADRTLPASLAHHNAHNRPSTAILATAGIVTLIMLVVPDVSSAGAAASLIFLITFALVHGILLTARYRLRGIPNPAGIFRAPFAPVAATLGCAACLTLAIFQGLSVPTAGLIALVWISAGAIFFVVHLAQHARILDASSEGRDPELMRLRGNNPFVLVPIANPANAAAMVQVAAAMAPPAIGRVLLLSVVVDPATDTGRAAFKNTEAALGAALEGAWHQGIAAEALATIAKEPWREIKRVITAQRIGGVLFGLGALSNLQSDRSMERLISRIHCDVAILRALPGWDLNLTERILVPVGGGGHHAALRARILASLCRMAPRRITWLHIVSPKTSDAELARLRRVLQAEAEAEAPGDHEFVVERSESVADTIAAHATPQDLILLGLHRTRRHQKAIGLVPLEIAQRTESGLLILSRRG